MNVYFAAPFFTIAQRAVCGRVIARLDEHDHYVFDPDERSRDIWDGATPHQATAAQRRQVLEANRRGIAAADVVVAWLRGTGGEFTDQGVVWELGFATAMGIPTIGWVAHGEVGRNVNLMIAESLDAAVHETHLPNALSVLGMRGVDGLHNAFPHKALTHEGDL